MPNYKGHLIGGVGFYAATLYLVTIAKGQMPPLLTATEWLGCAVAGSMFPDIDIKSKGQKYFYWMILGGMLIFIVQERFDLLASLSVFSVTPLLVKHRGLFHNVWFLTSLVGGVWWLISMHFTHLSERLMFDAFFLLSGIYSHLWLDMGLRRMLKLEFD